MEEKRTMTIASDLIPPAWVYKRDGRLVPFDADKIARVLFAAGEEDGRSDPFLARELADGVVHFLAGDLDGQTPTTDQVAEVVVKVVRELGHPHLAEVFAEFSRRRPRETPSEEGATRRNISLPVDTPLTQIRNDCLRQYSLQSVFSRDLAAAHRDDLLTLMELETPAELAACLLLSSATLPNLLPSLEDTSRRAGEWIVIDGPEYALLSSTGKRLSRREIGKRANEWVQTLLLGLRLTGRKAILNLHVSPPPWADELAEGPLFAGQSRIADNEDLPLLADAIREGLREAGERVCLNWHLTEADFEANSRGRLLEVVRAALAGEPLAFTFDRPRRPVALAEGMDRRRPAVLMSIGLNLPRLATLVCEECVDESSRQSRLLERLRSLARLALSAGVQKRDYLRQQTLGKEWTTGFVLDRARLLVAPWGLEQAVEQIVRQRLCGSRQALEFGEQIVTRLQEVLKQEGRLQALECCVDSPLGTRGAETERVPGLTCWDRHAAVRSQLKVIGKLHGTTHAGTGLIVLPEDATTTVDQGADWLRWACQQTDVTRVCWVRPPTPHRQLLFS